MINVASTFKESSNSGSIHTKNRQIEEPLTCKPITQRIINVASTLKVSVLTHSALTLESPHFHQVQITDTRERP